MAVVGDFRGLISGYTWGAPLQSGRPVFLTYSFPVSPPPFPSGEQNAAASWSPLTEGEKNVVRQALDAWASVSGVKFLETTYTTGDLTFGFVNTALYNGGGGGEAGDGGYPGTFVYVDTSGTMRTYSGDYTPAGDIHFDTSYRASFGFSSDFLHVALHEIGHALGLKHPFDFTSYSSDVLSAAADNGRNTVMSYDQAVRATTLGPLDVAAAQYLYGPASADGTQDQSWAWDQAAETLAQVVAGDRQVVRGTGANDYIVLLGNGDAVATSGGRDIILANGHPVDVNGGGDLDRFFTGLPDSFVPQLYTSGDFHALQVSGGYQYMTGIERITFASITMAFDTSGDAGEAYRLYSAAYARSPDRTGLSYWVNRLDHGTSLQEVSQAFVSSAEFQSIYGANPSAGQMVTKLYQNILGRAPDASGLNYWMGIVQQGMTRADLLISFSEGAENVAHVAPSIAGGIVLDSGIAIA